VDDDLKDLLEDGVATVVGTRDADLVPEIARGWGVRVLDDRGSLELCLGLPSAQRTLDNLAANGRLAVTCVRPSDYRQVQLKGRLLTTLSPTPEDREWVERHQRGFALQVEGVGIAAALAPRFWNHDDPDAMVKVRFAIEETYDQTPGPDAGRKM
jgi:hypothetical protein